MPKFDVNSIGGSLEYDFSDPQWLGPGDGHKGFIPEPSRQLVNDFLKNIQAKFKEMGLVGQDASDSATAQQVASTLSNVDDESTYERIAEEITAEVAKLCGGSPSLEVLQKLPYRPFMGFVGYVMGNLLNPEAGRPGTTNSPSRLTSV
jgi:hypothetical protein